MSGRDEREEVRRACRRLMDAEREAGGLRPVRAYQGLFPGFEDVVAEEYESGATTVGRAGADRTATSDGAPSDPGAGARDSRERIGPYRLLRELGRGGMGVVYEAEDERLRRRVALKVLSPQYASSRTLRLRFEREASIASRLDHPNICTVYEAGEADGVPFMAMRLVEGRPLSDFVAGARGAGRTSGIVTLPGAEARGGASAAGPGSGGEQRLALDRVLLLFERAARALHHAHEKGLVHRDVKPHNVMVTAAGDPVLLDFGLAREEDGEGHGLTQTGSLMGTPAYMSPEQLTAQRIRLDRRTDVYSLGASLYECVTLHLPFEAPTVERLYQRILATEPEDPRRLNPAIPPDLRVVMATAMEKDRDRRYQTAEDLAEELRRVRDHEPIRARPVGALGRLVRWSRRNRAVAALLSALFLALVAGLAGALHAAGEMRAYALRVEDERGAALVARDVAERARREQADSLERERAERKEKEAALAAARAERDEKDVALRRNEGLRLITQGNLALERDPTMALLLGIEGADRAPGRDADELLLRAMDAQTERWVWRFPGDRITSIAYGADGDRVLRMSEHDRVRVFDLADGRLVAAVGASPGGFRGSFAWSRGAGGDHGLDGWSLSAGGRWLLRQERVSAALVWDLRAPGPPRALPGTGTIAAGFARGGTDVHTVEWDGTCRVIDPATGDVRATSRAEFAGRVESLYGSRPRIVEGPEAAETGAGRPAWLLDPGGPRSIAAVPQGFRASSSTAMSADGRLLLLPRPDGPAALWDLERSREVARVAVGERGRTAFSPDGALVASFTHDGWLVVSTATGLPVAPPLGGSPDPSDLLAFASDDLVVVASGVPATLRVWHVGGVAPPRTLATFDSPVASLATSPTGEGVAVVTVDGVARVFHLAPRGEREALRPGPEGSIGFAAFADGGRRVVTAGEVDGTIRVADALTGRTVATLAAIVEGMSVSLPARADDPRDRVALLEGFLSLRDADGDCFDWLLPEGAPAGTGAPSAEAAPAAAEQSASEVPAGEATWLEGTGKRVPPWTVRSPDGLRAAYVEAERQWFPHARGAADTRVWTGVSLTVRIGAANGLEGEQVPPACLRSARWVPAEGEPPGLADETEVVRVAFSGDGARLVVATARRVDVLDASTGAVIASHDAEPARVRDLHVSTTGDRALLLLTDGGLRCWEPASGAVTASAPPPAEPVRAWTADGRCSRVARVTIVGSVSLWEVGAAPAAAVGEAAGPVVAAVLDPSGMLLLTGSDDGTTILWDVATRIPRARLEGHRGEVFSASFDPGGTRALTASMDGSARTWEIPSGRPLAVVSGHRVNSVRGAAFVDGGGRVLAVTETGAAAIRETGSWNAVASLPEEIAPWDVSPDGARVATASASLALVRLRDAATGRVLATLPHASPVVEVEYCADGTRLVTGTDDGSVHVWSRDGRPVATLAGVDLLEDVALSRDGSRIATACHGPGVVVREVATGTVVSSEPKIPGEDPGILAWPMGIAFADEGQRILVSWWESVDLQDAADRRSLLQVGRADLDSPSRETDGSTAIEPGCWRLAPDGRRFAVYSSLGPVVRVFDARDGSRLAAFEGHPRGVAGVAFDSEGARAATVDTGGSVRTWDTTSGRMLAAMPSGGRSATFHPEGSALLVVGDVARMFPLDARRAASAAAPRTLTPGERHRLEIQHAASARALGVEVALRTARERAVQSSILRYARRDAGSSAGGPTRWEVNSPPDPPFTVDVLLHLEALELDDDVRREAIAIASEYPDDPEALRAEVARYADSPGDDGIAWTREARSLERALRWAREAAARAPGDPDVAAALGAILLLTGDVAGARAALEGVRGGRFAFARGSAIAFLGMACYRAGDVSAGRAALLRHLARGQGRSATVAADLREVLAEADASLVPVPAAVGAAYAGDGTSDDVARERLRADVSLSPEALEFALRVVTAREEEPGRANAAAWEIAKSPGGAAEACARAVRLGEAAVRAEPDNHHYVNTLGVARYRAGDLAGAREALLRAEALNRAATDRYNAAADSAVLAMACHRLGLADEATAHLARAREATAGGAGDADTRALVAEAEALIAAAAGVGPR